MTPTEQAMDQELDGLFDRLVSLARGSEPDGSGDSNSSRASDVRRHGPPDRGDELNTVEEESPSSPAESKPKAVDFSPSPRDRCWKRTSEKTTSRRSCCILAAPRQHEGGRDRRTDRLAIPSRRKAISGTQGPAGCGRQLRQPERLRLRNHRSGNQSHRFIRAAMPLLRRGCCVSLADYEASIAAQSLSRLQPTVEDLQRAFTDLTISPEMFCRLGLAITSGKGLFLHGRPGNGKTSVAERIPWPPARGFGFRVVSACGEIIHLFDPSVHEEMPLRKGAASSKTRGSIIAGCASASSRSSSAAS